MAREQPGGYGWKVQGANVQATQSCEFMESISNRGLGRAEELST